MASAGKVEFCVGPFNFSAKNPNNNTTASVSGVGSYRLAYRHAFWSQFELDLGYSLVATDTFGGDLSFGVDVGANYFPLSVAGDVVDKTVRTHVLLQQIWRPFVGVSFNQRNFQSTSSQYAGAGVKLGTEYQLNEEWSLLGAGRYISLGGPNQSEATQTEILLGAVIQF